MMMIMARLLLIVIHHEKLMELFPIGTNNSRHQGNNNNKVCQCVFMKLPLHSGRLTLTGRVNIINQRLNIPRWNFQSAST